jgi:hypothetical protein
LALIWFIALTALVALSLALALAALILKRAREGGSSTNCPEAIAYWLLVHVAGAEGKSLSHHHIKGDEADRKWILDTFAECMLAVRSPEKRHG